ncbi:MAG TPA: secretin N-terminal domain-containing protein [Rugosibacter sp.]|jgi:MSHA biogenesis protein MshL|nr:secretin N-terminal domain-containing protein [Rugosibacter sp.]HQN46651.1 secretin N-terminal domain-containing protein [Rugosibacter sp.]
MNAINDELLQATANRKAAPVIPDSALMPSLVQVPIRPPSEPRFDLSVIEAPANQVFMALVSGTPYSMLLPPDLNGNITITLKNATLLEALDTIRELFGYEYRVQGKRIFIEANTMKTRVFQINFLASRRQGSSDLRVTGNSITTGGGKSGGGDTQSGQASSSSAENGASSSRSNDTSRVSMTTDSDFWGDLKTALTAILGTTDGRSVVINAASGVVVVRAMPGELANVEKYLKATQLIADRQVMIEAKIVDVALSEGYQSGINWSTFNGKNNRFSAGVVQPGGILRAQPGQAISGIPSDAIDAVGRSDTLFANGSTLLAGTGGLVAASALGQGFLGLAFQSANFSALLNFLETQGSVTVLSSPRIATVNNQKAVLKVGTDELFITNLTTSTTTTTTGTIVTPSLTLEPYFSGISLDVTPQIDDDGNIVLHVHPMVSVVNEKNKTVNMGTLGSFSLPLATSNINETDSIVRIQDGNIVAIGGLMRQEQSSDRSQLPGATGIVANLLGQKNSGMIKRELVILIKPTIIRNDQSWTQDIKAVQERLQAYQPTMKAAP